MLSVKHLIARLKAPLLEDGVISLGETSLLIRALRPFVQKGDGMACELRDLLVRVRMDGVISPDESRTRLLDTPWLFGQYKGNESRAKAH